MASTQDHLPILDIHDDVVLLKDGSVSVVLETSAVNFGLLSENEQLAIISSFAGLLNSLSFMIQILIRSKKLDISTYLSSLDMAQAKQKNPLLYSMISRYKAFIQNTIAENEVLDKQFFIVVSVSGLELGLGKSAQNDFKKALTLLYPRRDNIIRQLSRIGLRATQLNSEALVKLYYDIYNESGSVTRVQAQESRVNPENKISTQIQQPIIPENIPSIPQPIPQPTQPKVIQVAPARRSPYIVEELPEDYAGV